MAEESVSRVFRHQNWPSTIFFWQCQCPTGCIPIMRVSWHSAAAHLSIFPFNPHKMVSALLTPSEKLHRRSTSDGTFPSLFFQPSPSPFEQASKSDLLLLLSVLWRHRLCRRCRPRPQCVADVDDDDGGGCESSDSVLGAAWKPRRVLTRFSFRI